MTDEKDGAGVEQCELCDNKATEQSYATIDGLPIGPALSLCDECVEEIND